MGFAPTWLRHVSPPPASRDHFNHGRQKYDEKADDDHDDDDEDADTFSRFMDFIADSIDLTTPAMDDVTCTTNKHCWIHYVGAHDSLSLSLSLSLRFNGHFPGEPGLAGVY